MSFELELAFDTDHPEFCRGFEAADVYNAVRAVSDGDDEEHVETVHATNAEMMLRIADRFDMLVKSEEVGNGWLHVVFRRAHG